MAELKHRPVVHLTMTLTLSEMELRAMEALAGYGDDAFISMFYKKLGRHYLHPHEAGLRSLLTTIREEAPEYLRRVDDARKALK